MEKELRRRFGVSRKEAMRLVYTEGTFIMNEASMQVFDGAYEQYRYSAIGDSHTCDVCAGLNGEVFDIKSRQPGANFPPMHPGCRCAFEVVIDNRDGLSSKDGLGEQPHKPLETVEHIDITDKAVLKSKIKEYGRLIKDEPIENAIVILKNGEVKRCYGGLNGVWPNSDLGDTLRGSIMLHNHPLGSDNEYSFSNADINLFVDYELEMLQGIDEKFIYQISRTDDTVDEVIPLAKFTEYDSRSETVRGRIKKMGYGYRRWLRNDK